MEKKLYAIGEMCIRDRCTTSLVSYSIIFRSLFSVDGFINTILTNLHLIASPINWLGNTWTARIVIVLALLWRWTGYNMIFFLAALQNIDSSIYEAAVVDGANAFQKFTKITICLLYTSISVRRPDRRYMMS